MTISIDPVVTNESLEAIYRFRYKIYVEEMNRYGKIADHAKRQLREEVDQVSRHFRVTDGEKTVGCMRLTWGGDASIPDRMTAQYDLEPYIDLRSQIEIIIGERFMVAPDYRGTDLLFKMFCTYLNFVNEHRIQLIFGDCEPHLLNLYLGLGFRTYTTRNVNSEETGYLIPMVMVAEDIEYMRRIGSPLAEVLIDFGPDSKFDSSVTDLLGRGSAVKSHRFSKRDTYWAEIQNSLGNVGSNQISPFDGLSESQVISCLSKSCIIQCNKEDRVVKKGNVARNMYIVLSGVLEVRQGDQMVNTLTTGDIFGEMAFLVGTPRTADVVAVSDDVKVLGLSESEIWRVIETDPGIAAVLMLNVSRILCRRILNLYQ